MAGTPSFVGLSDAECCPACIRRLDETLMNLVNSHEPDQPPTDLALQEWEAQVAGWGIGLRAELDKRQRIHEEEEEARERAAKEKEGTKKEEREKEQAETARKYKECRGMRANDDIELKREAEMDAAVDGLLEMD